MRLSDRGLYIRRRDNLGETSNFTCSNSHTVHTHTQDTLLCQETHQIYYLHWHELYLCCSKSHVASAVSQTNVKLDWKRNMESWLLPVLNINGLLSAAIFEGLPMLRLIKIISFDFPYGLSFKHQCSWQKKTIYGGLDVKY